MGLSTLNPSGTQPVGGEDQNRQHQRTRRGNVFLHQRLNEADHQDQQKHIQETQPKLFPIFAQESLSLLAASYTPGEEGLAQFRGMLKVRTSLPKGFRSVAARGDAFIELKKRQWHPASAQHIIAKLRRRNNPPLCEKSRPFKDIS